MSTDTSPAAPTTDSRQWFQSVPADWDAFQAFRAEANSSREARRSLRDWMAEHLDESTNHLRKTLGLYAAGEPELALPHLEACDEPLARLLTGACLRRAGRTREADKLWTSLKDVRGLGPVALTWKLELQLQVGDADGADETLAAIKAAGVPAAWLAYAEGVAAEARGDHPGAIASWRLSLQHEPERRDARFRLARRLDLQGQDDEAHELYASFLGEDEAAPVGVLMNLGILFEDKDDFRNAVRCYRRVVEADPTNRRARRYLADAEASQAQYYDETRERKVDKQNAVLRIPVTDFELSVRARNCLQRMNIHTLGDLVSRTETELLAFKNFGETSLQEVKDILGMKGLRLGMLPPHARSNAGDAGPALVDDLGEGDMMTMRISDLDLSVRSRAALSTLGIATLGDLVNTTEATLMSCKNFGQTSLEEIKSKLSSMGLELHS